MLMKPTSSITKILGSMASASMLFWAAIVASGCDPHCQSNATLVAGQCVCDKGFVENAPGTCTAKPRETCQSNMHLDASNKCVCDEGFVENSPGTCAKPRETCQANMHLDASNKCVCDGGFMEGSSGVCEPVSSKPDLTIDNFSLSAGPTSDAFAVCVSESSDFISIKNIGSKDAGPYQVAIGLFDVSTRSIAGGCLIDVKRGTQAHSTTKLTQLGCCSIPRAKLKSGSKYSIFALADAGKAIAESDEDNNSGLTNPFVAPLVGALAGLIPMPSGASTASSLLESTSELSSGIARDEQQ